MVPKPPRNLCGGDRNTHTQLTSGWDVSGGRTGYHPVHWRTILISEPLTASLPLLAHRHTLGGGYRQGIGRGQADTEDGGG